jgi:regulation of enolase protein 1 (concanavalin A-like superfamily)
MRKVMFVSIVALGLLGLANSAMAADPGKGHILVEYWLDIGNGTAVTDLTSNALFPDNPTGSQWVDSWLFPPGSSGGSSWHDNYGDRMRGYIYPPQTGDYTFWIAGDDLCELWLSTDDTPANAKLIAQITGWTDAMDWDQATGSTDKAAMKSQPIPLKAGQRYYMETLHKEAGGGDSVGVAWAGPGIGATHVLLDGKYCAAFIRDPEPMFMARNPNPADGTIGVSAPLLQWTVGGTAMFHDVYFGTDPNPPLVSPKQMFAMYYYIQGLQPGATYYWKVDEIEADGTTMHAGPVWSFVAQALTAYYPTPADQAGSVSPAATLTWQAGQNATKHHLYLSDSLDAVTQGDASADKGEMEETSYTPTDLLGATTYYWRVDELAPGGTVRTGDVWSFTTFILVDDFESYNDDLDAGTTIFDTWIDGLTDGLSGSTVGNFQAPFAEQTIVHGGTQSMPMDFDNTKDPFFSEAVREFAPLQDWTVNDVNTLSLWVRGNPVRYVDEGDGAFTVGASGHDIWDTADDFRFVYKSLSGDGSVTVKVDSLANTNAWAKAGVMIRESLDAGSAMAYMIQSYSSGASFGWRVTMSATCGSANQSGINAPQWVKLTRTGNAFTAQYSADGKTWTDVVDATTGQPVSTLINMAANCYIGLCVTSHDSAATTIAELSGAATTGGVTGSWKETWIGDDPDLTNGSSGLYLAVEDSAGKSAVVTHPDPAAANLAAWTPWKIPLSDLAGINLAKVKKLYIGVGDKANPVADGTGRVYIDDIQVDK